MRFFSKGVLVAAVMVGTGACDFVTEPDMLQDFQWGRISESEFGGDRIEISPFGGQISMLGESVSPTECYEAVPDFTDGGRTLTMKVTFRSTRANCPEGETAFRWLASIRGLERGTYTVRAIQVYQDGARPTVEVVDTITFR